MESKDRSRLRNLGPKSWQMLETAGIVSVAQLTVLGSVAAYVQVKKSGCQPSLNLLWALEGALADRHWKAIAKEQRMSLLFQLDDYEKAGSQKAPR